VEHEKQADRLEHEADQLEEESDRVGEHIDDTRREWEAKEQDPAVPGARPDPAEEEEAVPGVQVDEERVSEEGGP
jgi:phage shock protein A